jgi:hypothetical protein
MTEPRHPQPGSPGRGDSTAAARARAACLFAVAARGGRGLSRDAQTCLWAAVAALAVTPADIEDERFDLDHSLPIGSDPGSAHEAIRQGLSVLGLLDLDLFADPRVRAAAKHARRAFRLRGD